MIKNYLKIAFRNILKNKLFSVLNVLGLAIGIAASLLIILYARFELSYDDFHKDADQIYRIRYDFKRDGELVFKCASTFPAVGPTLKEEYQQVEEQTRLYKYFLSTIEKDGELFDVEYIFFAEQAFIDMFSYPWFKGNKQQALVNTQTAVISPTIAEKYFGKEDPVGKRIKIGNTVDYEITGVMGSPENSHVKFDILLSYPTGRTVFSEGFETSWGWYDFYTYVKLKEGVDYKAFEKNFPDFIAKHTGEENRDRYLKSLQPVQDIHLYSNLLQEARVNGDGQTVNILIFIAIAILVIAWINYINLATAKALQRAKEVGIRKVVGAQRRQLITQFLFESWTLNIIAALFALLAIDLVLPAFNNLADVPLSLDYLNDDQFWMFFIGVLILGAILSGIYPAFVLSNYRPVVVLKGKFTHSFKGVWMRKGLVIFQFAASAMLILGTVVVFTQISYMRNQDLGIDIDQTLVISGPQIVANDTAYQQSWPVFKNEVSRMSAVKAMTTSSEVPGNLIYWTNGARRPSQAPESNSIMYKLGMDEDYLDLYGHELLAGRKFSKEINEENNVILNEKALNVVGYESPESAIGNDVLIGNDTLNIVGVVADFHQQGLKSDTYQVAMLHRPYTRRYYSIKLNTQDIRKTLSEIGELYNSLYPGNTFQYFFLDQHYDEQYKSEVRFGKVFTVFAILAIIVACLGLFGLSLFTAYQRTKEIGIRKIMGASDLSIFGQLSKQFIILVLVSNAIAWPIAWFVMNSWLSGFTYRIDLSLWMFLLAGFITLLIAIFTISYQSIRAALQSPVSSLRSE